MLKVDWNKVVTSAVCALVAAAVVGASAIIWRGATSVAEVVERQTAEHRAAVVVLAGRVESLEEALDRLTVLLAAQNANKGDNKIPVPAIGRRDPITDEINDRIQQRYPASRR